MSQAVSERPNQGAAFQPGDLVGNYRIERELAEGGMGTVYVATHTVLPRRAAIKVLRPELSHTPLARDGLVHEACVIESMHDPRVVLLYDAGLLADGRPWFAMELVDGECLADILARCVRLPLGEVAKIVCAIVDALGAAHARGVVHGDVKPENVMVCGGEHPTVKMIDWGISRMSSAADAPLAIGTPHYMAPEQVRGEQIDGRADLYALGVLAYELLVGAPPFVGENPSHIATQHLNNEPRSVRASRPETPPAIEALIAAMLRKGAADRPSIEAIHAGFALVTESALGIPAMGPVDAADDFQLIIEIDYADEGDVAATGALDEDFDGSDRSREVLARTRWTPQSATLSTRPTLRLGRVISSGGRHAASTAGEIGERSRS